MASEIDDQLFEAARQGDLTTLTALLDTHPDKLDVRTQPYEHTLLHLAAFAGHLAVVDLLLARGLDVNARERGDNTYAMHWAASAGHLDVVRRLADAGGDVVGHGDDHELEVIGWATCWEPSQPAVAEFLVSRGARHHIFSAIALDLADEVRRIVAADPAALQRRMSRNENHQLPLHFAVSRNRPHMVSLLVTLGADPLGVDGDGFPAAAYATSPDVDVPVMAAIGTMTRAEFDSAERGQRTPRMSATDLAAAAALNDWDTAARVQHDLSSSEATGGLHGGVLHLMAKRNAIAAAEWLIEHGADANARWSHWDSDVTPLHLAVLAGHAGMVRLLLSAGADPTIRDSKHDSDAVGWAEFFRRPDLVELLTARGKTA